MRWSLEQGTIALERLAFVRGSCLTINLPPFLLAFHQQPDVKTSEPSLPEEVVRHPTPDRPQKQSGETSASENCYANSKDDRATCNVAGSGRDFWPRDRDR
jgi:hypothetical protein